MVKRIIYFPIFLCFATIAATFVLVEWLVNYIRYGGEVIAYTEDRKTILDVYNKIKQNELHNPSPVQQQVD